MQTNPHHRDALLHLHDHLEREAIPTHLLPEGEGVPYDTLLVGIEGANEQTWRMELSFLPNLEEDLDTVSILQCFVPVVGELAPGATAALRDFLIRINPQLPLGSFGVLDEPHIVYFKHNALLPNQQTRTQVLITHELVMLTGYLLTLFMDALTRVARGEIDVATAMQDPRFAHIYR